MKCISVLLLSAAAVFPAAAFAADFTTGQAARLVIGQRTFTTQDPVSDDRILGGSSGLAFAADTLFVADSNRVGATPSNNRVLLFQNISGMLPAPTDELTPGDDNPKCPACVGRATLVLGQPDFTSNTLNIVATPNNLRQPTAVASDGVHLVIADTDHNRVLIWNRIPSSNNAPADVVLGQPNFTSSSVPTSHIPTASTLSGPQGVWIQNGKLYVADTQNNRVLIWNSIPTTNGAPANVVLGQPDFSTYVQVDLTAQNTAATASNMLSPVSVSSDGQRLFVTDLGYNRVLIWDSIPTSNAAPAQRALGQPDLNSSISNNGYSVDTNNKNKQTPVLCTESNGTDENGNPTYPPSCNRTLSFPRFALAAGHRLFIADGGNDRVLVFNDIPQESGAAADSIIGQIGGSVNQASDAADSLRTPMALAWDGTNLYVSDAFNRRITVYSIGENSIPYSGVRNAASLRILAFGSIGFAGEINAGDVVTVKIADTEYTHKVTASDTLDTVVDAFVTAINSANDGAGDPNVVATPNHTTKAVLLNAKIPDLAGNDIKYSATVSTNSKIFATAGGQNLTGGGDAAKIPAGTLVSILAKDDAVLAYGTDQADLTKDPLPTELAGAQVYFNGIRAPLLYVSPKQINAQIPWEAADTTSINAYVRAATADGGVVTTTPVAITIVPGNPGLFAYPDTEPAVGVAFHASSRAVGIVSVDGAVTPGDGVEVTINGRAYRYTNQIGDTLDKVRDSLVALINASDPEVTAEPSGVFDRIVLRAKVEGPEGNGITYSGTSIGETPGSTGQSPTVTAFGDKLCCANTAYAPITPDNPAQPGETIILYATGIGVPVLTDPVAGLLKTGYQYPIGGPVTGPRSDVQETLVNAFGGDVTANVISASLKPGTVGVYEVVLQLSSGATSDPYTKITVAQGDYVSNRVTIPVVSPLEQVQ